jgi:hypothetical protein
VAWKSARSFSEAAEAGWVSMAGSLGLAGRPVKPLA